MLGGDHTRQRVVRAVTVMGAGALFALTVFVLLAVHARREAQERLTAQALEWHARLALELPPDQQAIWRRGAREQPLALLRVCAMEHVVDSP